MALITPGMAHATGSTGILLAGKKRLLGNLALRFVCQMPSSNFSWENISCLPRGVLYHASIFYVNQADRVLNFARGQTSAD